MCKADATGQNKLSQHVCIMTHARSEYLFTALQAYVHRNLCVEKYTGSLHSVVYETYVYIFHVKEFEVSIRG